MALNPVVPYIELFRAPLTQGRVPDESVIVQALVISLVAFFVGLGALLSQERKIVFRL